MRGEVIPKDKPIIDRELLAYMKERIARCEWAFACNNKLDCFPLNPAFLEAAHVRAKGMGGGRRKDTPRNIIVLCPAHHKHYDNKLGQSPAMQEAIRVHIIEARPFHLQRELEEYQTKGGTK